MKHIPKYTPTEVLNDPYGFTYKDKYVNFKLEFPAKKGRRK